MYKNISCKERLMSIRDMLSILVYLNNFINAFVVTWSKFIKHSDRKIFPKCHGPWANGFVRSGPRLIHGSLDPCESAPNGISIDSVVFAQFTRVLSRQTHRHTCHATCDTCSNRPHLGRAYREWPTMLLTCWCQRQCVLYM